MSGLTLITPTHDRPVAFDLCQKYMERQTYSGEIQWIVADGGDTPVSCRLGQTHVRTNPVDRGVESFRKNYVEALKLIKHDRVVFIEDDELYKPDYLKRLNELFDTDVDAVGQARPRYYNVRYRKFMIHSNAVRRTSLCQSGFRSHCIQPMIDWLTVQRSPIYLDSHLYRHLSQFNIKRVNLDPESTLVVAMKGVTGSAGVGIGHQKKSNGILFDDPHGVILREWCGDDAVHYEGMYEQ